MNILRCTLFAVLLALVLVVGCGEKAEKQLPVMVPASREVQALDLAEAKAAAEAKAMIEKAIRKELKKPSGELTKADLEKVTKLRLRIHFLAATGLKLTQLKELYLGVNQLTSVKGLEKLTELTELWLNNNQLTDVKGLEKLTKLEFIHLGGNQLTDVKSLEKLSELKSLSLLGNPDLTKAQIDQLQKALPNCKIFSNPTLTKEESAKFIAAAIRKKLKKPTGELTEADLVKVTYLNFEDKKLTDVKGLEKLEKLTTLNLSLNKLTELPKGLEKLKQLKALDLSWNKLTDVKDLENLTVLTKLNLTRNKLTDVKSLEKLTQLTWLYLDGNGLTDVTGLEKLTQLTRLNLRDNHGLTKAQIEELQKALPKCDIYVSYHLQ